MKLDYYVLGYGTGGTFSGAGKAIKERGLVALVFLSCLGLVSISGEEAGREDLLGRACRCPTRGFRHKDRAQPRWICYRLAPGLQAPSNPGLDPGLHPADCREGHYGDRL